MKNMIKQILRESTDEGKYIKLSVFDFDGTLVDTGLPHAPEGRPSKDEYERITKEKWPFTGWWGRKESLSTDIFDFKSIDSNKQSFNQEIKNNKTLTLIITGRLNKLRPDVINVLKKTGYKINDNNVFCNNNDDTLVFKKNKLDDLLDEYPSIKYVELWDDRDEHIASFEEWGQNKIKSGRLNDFKMNHVPFD